jgi:transcriptional regulator with XRE-family HTH domain
MDMPGFSESLEPAILGEADESVVVMPAVSVATENTVPNLSEGNKTELGDSLDFEAILKGGLPSYLDKTLAGYFQNLEGAVNFDEASQSKYDSLRVIVQAYKDHHGLTLADIANRAGVSKATISRVLGGSQNPSPPLARNLARIVGVDPDLIPVLEGYKTEIMTTPKQELETDRKVDTGMEDVSSALSEAQAQLKAMQADLEQARAQAATFQEALEATRLEKRRGEADAIAVKLSEYAFSPSGDKAPSFSEADNALEAFVVSLSEEQADYFASLINSLESPKQPAGGLENSALFSEYTAEKSEKPEILGDTSDESDPIAAARIKAAELYSRP